MPETKLAYYEDPDKFDFEAKVIAVIKDGVVRWTIRTSILKVEVKKPTTG